MRRGGKQKIVEGAERAAAFNPYVARLQALAQRRHDRDFIGPAIDAGVGLDELAPCRSQKSRRRAAAEVSSRRSREARAPRRAPRARDRCLP